MCVYVCDARTLQDVYIITSMTIVITVCVWHAVVPAISFAWGRAMADTCDIVVAVALGAVYVVAHIVFAFVITTRVSIMTAIILRLICDSPLRLRFAYRLTYGVFLNLFNNNNK